jgi:TM2 domain-containing membrane protein YozV
MRRKNSFFYFCVFTFAGAGQMYLGFMKQGMTTMFIFFMTIFLADFFRVSFVLAILPESGVTDFFDTFNKAGLSPEEFAALEDRSIFEKFLTDSFSFARKHFWLGVILMSLGILLLLDNLCFHSFKGCIYWIYYIAQDFLRTVVAAAALIGLGFKMIKGKKV